MYRKPITYTDFNGVEKTKDFYFNLIRPELVEMKRSPLYEMQGIIERLRGMKDPDKELSYEEKDEIQEKMGSILRNLVIQSYGVKSEDGEFFSKRIGEDKFGQGRAFVESMAYDSLYMEMLSDVSNFVKFVRAIVPPDTQNMIDTDPGIQESLKEIEAAQAQPDNVVPIPN